MCVPVEYIGLNGDGNKVNGSIGSAMEFADDEFGYEVNGSIASVMEFADEFGWMKLVSCRLAFPVADDNVESRSLLVKVGIKSGVSAICGDNGVKVSGNLAEMSTVGMLIKLLAFLCRACQTFSDSWFDDFVSCFPSTKTRGISLLT